jgi:hypothetical protein
MPNAPFPLPIVRSAFPRRSWLAIGNDMFIYRRPELPPGHAWSAVLLGLAFLLCAGCTGSGTPSTLSSLDISPHQWDIAAHYQREALTLRQQAEEYMVRAAVYEQLFGLQSDWVTGARLLSQFYEESAREQERLADVHRQLTPGVH